MKNVDTPNATNRMYGDNKHNATCIANKETECLRTVPIF